MRWLISEYFCNLVCVCGFFSGVNLTANTLMERLDNGVLLCRLAQLLQEKMIHANNGKVLHQHKCNYKNHIPNRFNPL